MERKRSNRILLIENNELLARTFAEQVQSEIKGVEVQTYPGVLEAKQACEKESFALVIADCHILSEANLTQQRQFLTLIDPSKLILLSSTFRTDCSFCNIVKNKAPIIDKPFLFEEMIKVIKKKLPSTNTH